MKNTILIIILTVICCNLNAKDYRAKLISEYGSFSHVAVSPSEDLFYGIYERKLYKTKSFDQLWDSVSVKGIPISDPSLKNFIHVYFLTDDIIIAFTIGSEKGEYVNYIYKSINRGKDWKKIKIKEGRWNRYVFIDDQKRIWAIISPSGLYRSSDMGDTWQKVELPLIFKNNRITLSGKDDSIFIIDDNGSIYKTTDSFEKLTPIHSPILKSSKEHIPSVYKFEQLGDYYIAEQNNQVFYSKTDSIDWKKFSDATDFILSNKSKAYLLNNDRTIFSINSEMEIEWTTNEKLEYSGNSYSVNDNLYVFEFSNAYKINKNTFSKYPIYTDEYPIKEGYLKIKWKDEEISFDNGDVLRFDEQNNQWYRYMNLPFDFNYAAIYDSKILLTDYQLENHYLLDLNNQTYKKLILSEKLVNLTEKKIKSFRIERAAGGCFHFDKSAEDYSFEKNIFIKQPLAKDTTRETQPTPMGLNKTKDEKIIRKLLEEINETARKELNVKDIGITSKDIDNYKSYIYKKKKEFIEYQKELEKDTVFKSEELIINSPPRPPMTKRGDFEHDLYIPREDLKIFEQFEILADSILELPDSIVTSAFETDPSYGSTEYDWIKLTVHFDDDTSISISNEGSEHNYLFTPWEVDYEGLKIKTNSFKVGRILNEIGEGKLILPIYTDKRYAIHQLVEYLYNKKEKDGSLNELVYTPHKKESISYTFYIIIVVSLAIVIVGLLFINRKK